VEVEEELELELLVDLEVEDDEDVLEEVLMELELLLVWVPPQVKGRGPGMMYWVIGG